MNNSELEKAYDEYEKLLYEKKLLTIYRYRYIIKLTNIAIKRIIEENKDRITPICPYFEECGGCDLMHMTYEKELNYKYV